MGEAGVAGVVVRGAGRVADVRSVTFGVDAGGRSLNEPRFSEKCGVSPPWRKGDRSGVEMMYLAFAMERQCLSVASVLVSTSHTLCKKLGETYLVEMY